MNHDAFDWNLLARYVLGECSATEAEAVRRWTMADARYAAEVELMRRACDLASELPSREELDAMWRDVAAALEGPAASAGSARDPRPATKVTPLFAVLPVVQRARRPWVKPLAIAAMLALVAGGAVALSRLELRDKVPTSAQRTGTQEFHTPRGQRGIITLLDGTRVALGPDSRLQVRILQAGPREITLNGEAVFEVTHDALRPFLVRAGGAVTEDLGTTFGVRAYAGEPVRVVVREGAVAVRDTAGHGAVVLAPRDLARVDGNGRVEVERRIDPERYLAWTTGRLVFQQAPLADIVVQLDRWFDVRVIVEDSALLQSKVTASFDDDGLDYVLRALATSLDARVERQDRAVYLRDRN